jgi:hypothetical protein
MPVLTKAIDTVEVKFDTLLQTAILTKEIKLLSTSRNIESQGGNVNKITINEHC